MILNLLIAKHSMHIWYHVEHVMRCIQRTTGWKKASAVWLSINRYHIFPINRYNMEKKSLHLLPRHLYTFSV